jgi:SAM-dependent methyltransferase
LTDRGLLRTGYDRVAEEYVRRIYDELRHKPLDRALLDRFAASVRDMGTVCDIGCGPGHVGRYLHDQGLEVIGIDLSPAMIEQARTLNPGMMFRQGDMTALDVPDGAWAGIVAFYSIIHIPRPEMTAALRELRRVVRPGGRLLLAFHVGRETVHRDELWGHEVSIDFHFFLAEEIAACLRSAGWEVEEIVEREPYPEVEYPSRRAYLFARRADADRGYTADGAGS